MPQSNSQSPLTPNADIQVRTITIGQSEDDSPLLPNQFPNSSPLSAQSDNIVSGVNNNSDQISDLIESELGEWQGLEQVQPQRNPGSPVNIPVSSARSLQVNEQAPQITTPARVIENQVQTNTQAAAQAIIPQTQSTPLQIINNQSLNTSTNTVQSTSIASGSYSVQLSSQRSDGAARQTFASLQRRYGSVLGGYSPLITPREISGRGTFYQVKVGQFSSQSEANNLCNALKAQGGDCFVTRN